MRGRKPKPTARQIAAGDPGRKGVNKLRTKLATEPRAERGLQECPKHLRGRAREAWKFWSEELAAMNLDRKCDSRTLEAACMAYESIVESYETIQRQGRFVPKRKLDPKTGELVVVDIKTHPAVSQGDRAMLIMKAFCSDFGLSPVSRTRLIVDHKEDEMDLMELLSRPRTPKPVAVQ